MSTSLQHGGTTEGVGSDAAAAPGAEHPQAGTRTYVVVAAMLLAITVMEVWVFYIPALARVLVPILLSLSAAKFALVAMFYMHLRFDHPWFSYLFVAPLIIALGLAVALLWLFGVIGTTGIRAVGAAGAG